MSTTTPAHIIHHPQHERIRQAIYRWFHRPLYALDPSVAVGENGTYWNHGDAYPSQLKQSDVPAFLQKCALSMAGTLCHALSSTK